MMKVLRRADRWICGNYGTLKGSVRNALTLADWLSGRLDNLVRPDLSGVERLVFVCLGNINRSCFAESVARELGVPTCSIGLSTTTGAPAFHRAVSTARDRGIDLGLHCATDISDHQPRAGDLLLAMEVRHVRRLQRSALKETPIALLGGWGSPQRLHIHDPHVLSPEYFQTCFTLIESATRNLVVDWRHHRSTASAERPR